MKITLFALLFSTSALACPNLAGQYKTCQSIEGSDISYAEFSVVQRLENKIHTFHISSVDEFGERSIDTYKADGKVYSQEVTDEDTGTYSTYTTQSSCTATELKIVSSVFDEKLTVVMSKSGSKLIQKMSGSMLGMNVNATVVCE